MLLDLRVRGRPQADRRRARAEVLRAAVRARRPARARGAAVRRGPGRAPACSSRAFSRRGRWKTGCACSTARTSAWGRSRRCAEAAADLGAPAPGARAGASASTPAAWRRGAAACDRSRRGRAAMQAGAARRAPARRGRQRDRRPGARRDARTLLAGRAGRRVLARRHARRVRARPAISGSRTPTAAASGGSTTTPNVVEWGPAWLADGRRSSTRRASTAGARSASLRLPTGPSQRLAGSDGEEYGATVSRDRAARVRLDAERHAGGLRRATQTERRDARSTRHRRRRRPPIVHDLAWSPDGTTARLRADRPTDGRRAIVVDDGTTQTVDRARRTSPVWSPAGTRIAFAGAAGLAVRRAGRHRHPHARLGHAARLARRAGRRAEVPEPRAAPAERARHRAAARPLAARLHVDGRQPRPGHPLDPAARARAASHVMDVRQLITARGGGVRVDPARASCTTPSRRRTTTGTSSASTATSCAAPATSRCVVRDHKSGFCIADHYGTAIGVPHGPPRFLGNCAQFQPKATFVEEGASVGYTDRYPAFFHGQQLDITKRARRAATGSCIARTRTSTCARRATTTTSPRSSSASRWHGGTPSGHDAADL